MLLESMMPTELLQDESAWVVKYREARGLSASCRQWPLTKISWLRS